MKEIRDLYNNAYRKFTPDFINPENMKKIDLYMELNTETLRQFIKNYEEQFNLEFEFNSSSCLELGCGLGSLSFFLESKFDNYTGVDISSLAIAAAKQMAEIKNSNIDFQVLDVCSEIGPFQKKNYEIIIDSHLLHCLTKDEDRISYIKNMKKLLAPNGRFFLETMVFQPKMRFPVGYFFDEYKTLWVDSKDLNYPYRKILYAREIEEFLLEQGLKIEYLYFHHELSFCPCPDDKDFKLEYGPKTLRICAVHS